MNNIINKLQEAIYNRARERGSDIPSIIIMHPKTWIDLVELVMGNGWTSINRYSSDLKYQGITVVRSFDVKEEEFIVK